MITIEELDRLVRQEFSCTSGFAITLKEWEKKKLRLEEHLEPEYIDEDKIEMVKVGGYFDTYDEDLAYFLWKCGCSLVVTQDWIDGSPSCQVSIPQSEEEYLENVQDASIWWEEVIGEEE